MDVFTFRDKVVEDYGQFSRSFTQIQADDIRDFVDGKYNDGEYWPSPLIQLNPSFISGGAVSDLVDAGLLEPNAARSSVGGKKAEQQDKSWCCTNTSAMPSRSPTKTAVM